MTAPLKYLLYGPAPGGRGYRVLARSDEIDGALREQILGHSELRGGAGAGDDPAAASLLAWPARGHRALTLRWRPRSPGARKGAVNCLTVLVPHHALDHVGPAGLALALAAHQPLLNSALAWDPGAVASIAGLAPQPTEASWLLDDPSVPALAACMLEHAGVLLLRGPRPQVRDLVDALFLLAPTRWRQAALYDDDGGDFENYRFVLGQERPLSGPLLLRVEHRGATVSPRLGRLLCEVEIDDQRVIRLERVAASAAPGVLPRPQLGARRFHHMLDLVDAGRGRMAVAALQRLVGSCPGDLVACFESSPDLIAEALESALEGPAASRGVVREAVGRLWSGAPPEARSRLVESAGLCGELGHLAHHGPAIYDELAEMLVAGLIGPGALERIPSFRLDQAVTGRLDQARPCSLYQLQGVVEWAAGRVAPLEPVWCAVTRKVLEAIRTDAGADRALARRLTGELVRAFDRQTGRFPGWSTDESEILAAELLAGAGPLGRARHRLRMLLP